MNRLPLNVYRAMRARPAYLSTFVPLFEDFFDNQNHCRNAILVDVVPPTPLGHFPQETISNGLANQFDEYSFDFHIARYSERDFVIFFPDWVQCDLRCELGQFISADDFSVRMVDLSSYKCLIAVNHLSDIPENLEIIFGGSTISVLIQLQRWAHADGDDGRGHPHNERSDQHNPLERHPVVDRRSAGANRGRRSSDGDASDSDASWNSSEIRDHRRNSTLTGSLVHSAPHVAPPPRKGPPAVISPVGGAAVGCHAPSSDSNFLPAGVSFSSLSANSAGNCTKPSKGSLPPSPTPKALCPNNVIIATLPEVVRCQVNVQDPLTAIIAKNGIKGFLIL
uniref:Uncharacterized protein n=1 Tax=Ananas comosus var. bracteatus TaxID=296719 RepID=A0A6V7NHE7_ANACO|nr:unnamed protein product [Ananas comosus var. bracteatus]